MAKQNDKLYASQQNENKNLETACRGSNYSIIVNNHKAKNVQV